MAHSRELFILEARAGFNVNADTSKGTSERFGHNAHAVGKSGDFVQVDRILKVWSQFCGGGVACASSGLTLSSATADAKDLAFLGELLSSFDAARVAAGRNMVRWVEGC